MLNAARCGPHHLLIRSSRGASDSALARRTTAIARSRLVLGTLSDCRNCSTSAASGQQAVVRYLEEFSDKASLSDDKDYLKKLDPYLRSRRLDAIDMTALQPFMRDRKMKDGVSNATVNRALEVVTDTEHRASGMALAPRGSEDPDAQGTETARAFPEARGS